MADPQKRIFVGYLIASGLLALWVFSRQGVPIGARIKTLISKDLWLHPSVLLDLKLIVVNNALWLVLLAPLLGSQLALALACKRLLVELFGRGDIFSWSSLTVSLIYTLVLFVVDDFARFISHYLYHKLPILWRFHAVHHSATVLTPLTLYRVHIIEMMLNALRSILVTGLIGGIFIYLFHGKIAPMMIFGVAVFSLLFNLAGSNLRHSQIYLGFGKLERWLISPAQHQIHHSADASHFNKNFGVMMAVWDRLFGTWLSSETEKVTAFGIGGNAKIKQSLWHHIKGL